MNRRQAQDMLRHAAFLRTVPRKAFNMGVVCEVAAGKGPRQAFAEPECGFAACAIGVMPAWRPRMFSWGGGSKDAWLIKGAVAMEVVYANRPMPPLDYGQRASFSVVRDFYGLDWDDSHHLFSTGIGSSPMLEATPAQVALRMERFAKKRLAQLGAKAKAGRARAMAKGRKGAKA